jgi:hypothetical protein
LTYAERFVFGSFDGLAEYLETKEASESPMTSDEQKKTKDFNWLINKGKELGII